MIKKNLWLQFLYFVFENQLTRTRVLFGTVFWFVVFTNMSTKFVLKKNQGFIWYSFLISCFYEYEYKIFDHCVVCPSLIYQFWLLFWPLCCLSFDWPILITLLTIVLSVLWLTNSDYSFDHCVVCPLIDQFWLLFWNLQTLLEHKFCTHIRKNNKSENCIK
jgi:hypothetical protein